MQTMAETPVLYMYRINIVLVKMILQTAVTRNLSLEFLIIHSNNDLDGPIGYTRPLTLRSPSRTWLWLTLYVDRYWHCPISPTRAT